MMYQCYSMSSSQSVQNPALVNVIVPKPVTCRKQQFLHNITPHYHKFKTSKTPLLQNQYYFSTFQCKSQSQQQEYYQVERLFSNLNQATLKREPGSLSSAIFLVAGTTVGAGILAIPAVTQDAGFLASALVCILCWIFMVITGLLVAEVNVKTMCELGSGGVSLVSMAKRTLGTAGVQIACWSYIFIHYALLVAYVARSSDILTNFLSIPLWESATVFSVVFGGICYFGSQRFIGAINGLLVFGIIISFSSLVVAASGDLQFDALLKANFEAASMSIPIIALSFVYQNVVPVLCTNLEGNLSKVRTAIVLGTGIPLGLFLVWNAVILGSITNSEMADKIVDPLQQLQSTNGVVGPIIEAFSFLAIATSYIGFVLGLADFISDLLKLPAGQNRPLPYLLTLVPPLALSLLDPEIFFKALDFAGTYGVLVLFGIIPAAMAWSDRYSNSSPSIKLPELVPGGRFTLSLVIGAAGYVILSEMQTRMILWSIEQNTCLIMALGVIMYLRTTVKTLPFIAKTGFLVVDQGTMGQSSQTVSIIGSPLAAVLSTPLRLVTTNVYGMAAIAIGVYCASRYAADIGMRRNVLKVSVEDLTRRLATGLLQVVEPQILPTPMQASQ